MKRTIFSAAILLAGLSIASAADVLPYYKSAAPLQSAYSWGGGYVGINGGYGVSNDTMSIAGANAIGNAVVATGAVPGSLNTHPRGGFVGAQIGYNWQSGFIVYGLEADMQYSDIKGSASQTLSLAPLNIPVSLTTAGNSNLDWFGTVRARVGYLVTPNTLFYGTGGLAYGNVSGSTSVTLAAPAPFAASAVGTYSNLKTGYTVGGGIEHAITPSVILRTEYSYIDLGSHSTSFSGNVNGTPVNFTSRHDDTFHRFGAGVSYRFNAF